MAADLSRTAKRVRALQGSASKEPIGVIQTQDYPCVAVVEGGPDTLAAFHFMLVCGTQDVVAPICMESTSAEFSAADLKRLRGKSVLIFPHHTKKEERQATLKWLAQLETVCADIEVIDLRGLCKDLNELTTLEYDDCEQCRFDLETLMIFEGRVECHAK